MSRVNIDQEDYESRCRSAATDQGLDPVAAILDANGITYGIEQTGGWVMVLMIPIEGDRALSVTAEDGYLVCDGETVVSGSASLADIVEIVHKARS